MEFDQMIALAKTYVKYILCCNLNIYYFFSKIGKELYSFSLLTNLGFDGVPAIFADSDPSVSFFINA